MAPCRQLLLWSVPSIAVLLGIFWFRKKREYAKSDPGGRERIKTLKEELAEVLNAEAEALRISPLGKAERSIVKSAPIDIVPNGSSSQRSSPLELTDEEVDMEIEKIIRKKSIEKEKRQFADSFKQTLVVSSCRPEPSFKIKKSDKLCTSLQSKMPSSEDHVDNVIKNNNKNSTNTNVILETVNAECSQNNSTNLENVKSEEKVEEEMTVTETQNIDVKDNEEDEQIESEDTFSPTQSRLLSERDSANHSPMDAMLASPSMCHFSDNHSEVNRSD